MLVKNRIIFLFMALLFLMTGCEVVEVIFGAGFWLGIIVSVLVVVLIIWLLVKLFRRK